MGETLKITCEKCDKSWECKIGCGLLHGNIDFVLKAFPEETQKQIKMDVPQYSRALFDFNYYPAVCHHCHNIVSVPVLSFLDADYAYMGACPTCGQDIPANFLPERGTDTPSDSDADEKTEKITCPICGSSLASRTVDFWD